MVKLPWHTRSYKVTRPGHDVGKTFIFYSSVLTFCGVFRIATRRAKFSLATSAYTKGAKLVCFPTFSCGEKKCLPKGGDGLFFLIVNFKRYLFKLKSVKLTAFRLSR